MNRTDRLSAILIMLQTKKVVTSLEIAEKFEISQRTVYRDLRALDEAGVPIGAEAGVGYYLIDGYHLPPVMFTPEEAGSMLIAEKLVNSFSDESIKHNFGLASDKIKAVLPETHREFLGNIGEQIQVFHGEETKSSQHTNNFLTRIQQAISEKKCVKIDYLSKSKKELSSRVVEPVGLCFYAFNWHLIAFCRMRNDYRDFRVDRIDKLAIEEDCISENANRTISEYFEQAWKKQELFYVSVKFKASIIAHISSSRYYYGYYQEVMENELVTMNFAVNDYEYMANWILSLGKNVVSVEPKKFSQMLHNRVKQLADQYLNR